MKGHVLGHPSTRPKVLAPERTLSSVVVATVRVLLHSAMLGGASSRPHVRFYTQQITFRVTTAQDSIEDLHCLYSLETQLVCTFFTCTSDVFLKLVGMVLLFVLSLFFWQILLSEVWYNLRYVSLVFRIPYSS